jgi:ribose/xylose/arabinose/galactoside ABC-type transport system permease subunit
MDSPSFAFERLFRNSGGAIVAVLLFGLVGFILIYARLGRQIFALGGEPIAARLVGIPVNWSRSFRLWPFGLCASLTGIYLVSRLESAIDRRYQFQFGFDHAGDLGRHTVDRRTRRRPPGTLLGVLLVQTLNNVLNFLDVSTFYQWMIQGLIVIAAVSIFVEKRRRVA